MKASEETGKNEDNGEEKMKKENRKERSR